MTADELTQEMMRTFVSRIEELQALCARAADALDAEHVSRPRQFHPDNCQHCNLIAELRKAAQ